MPLISTAPENDRKYMYMRKEKVKDEEERREKRGMEGRMGDVRESGEKGGKEKGEGD